MIVPAASDHARRVIDAYLAEVGALRFEQLPDYQAAPLASITCGGAGIAYTLWRASRTLGSKTALRSARRWIDGALAWRRRHSAFLAPKFDRPVVASSVFHGRAGLDLVDALIAEDERDPACAGRARARLAVGARRADRPELMSGAAGFLIAATRIAGAQAIEAELRGDLLARARRGRWARTPARGIAHGQAGILFAILASRGELPGWILDAIDRLAAEPLERPSGSWCGGPAGLALLWVKAYEVTAEARFLDAARTAALDVLSRGSVAYDLCCGVVGEAYTMLALSRVDRTRDWVGEAWRFAAAALVAPAQSEWAFGLLKGESGLVCLLLDLLHETTRFPVLEA